MEGRSAPEVNEVAAIPSEGLVGPTEVEKATEFASPDKLKSGGGLVEPVANERPNSMMTETGEAVFLTSGGRFPLNHDEAARAMIMQHTDDEGCADKDSALGSSLGNRSGQDTLEHLWQDNFAGQSEIVSVQLRERGSNDKVGCILI